MTAENTETVGTGSLETRVKIGQRFARLDRYPTVDELNQWAFVLNLTGAEKHFQPNDKLMVLCVEERVYDENRSPVRTELRPLLKEELEVLDL